MTDDTVVGRMDPQGVFSPETPQECTLTLTDEALIIIHHRMCGNATS